MELDGREVPPEIKRLAREYVRLARAKANGEFNPIRERRMRRIGKRLSAYQVGASAQRGEAEAQQLDAARGVSVANDADAEHSASPSHAPDSPTLPESPRPERYRRQRSLVDRSFAETMQASSTADIASDAKATGLLIQSDYERESRVRSLLEGCRDRLESCLGDPGRGASRNIVDRVAGFVEVQYFRSVFLRLAGSEIEGREVSLGVVVYGGEERIGIGSPFQSVEVCELLDSEVLALSSPVEAPRVYRQHIVGRAAGGLGQHVVLVNALTKRISGLYFPTLQASSEQELYSSITLDERYVAVRIRPRCSARIYRKGSCCAQVIRLRDGLGWSIRLIPELSRGVNSALKFKVGDEMTPAVIGRVLQEILDLSERGEGGALYIMKKSTFDDLRTRGRETNPETGTIANARVQQPWNLLQSPHPRLRDLLAQDGAVILSPEGSVLGSSVYFHGPGGRRQTAKATCAPTHGQGQEAVAIVVSQDGPISIAGIEETGIPGVATSWDVDRDRFE